ncbi:MAG: DoxX family protein [Chryseolinea sp.]
MKTPNTVMAWVGWSVSVLCILFLIVDFGMKILKTKISVDASVQLGWPADLVQTIGIICMVCTILYAIPQTSVIGAIALSAYLGGAVAIMMRSNTPYIFPIILGIMLWVGLVLRSGNVRTLLW